MLKDNKKLEKWVCDTGSSSHIFQRNSPSPPPRHISADKHIWSPPEVVPQNNMFKKKTLGCPVRSLKRAPLQLNETQKQIGTKYMNSQRMETLNQSKKTSLSDTSQTSNESEWTIANQNGDTISDAMYIGESQATEKRAKLGTRPVKTYIAKTHVQNGGMATRARRPLLLTSLQELSPSIISCAGRTDTHAWLKLRASQHRLEQSTFGSHPMWTQEDGTQTPMTTNYRVFFDDVQ